MPGRHRNHRARHRFARVVAVLAALAVLGTGAGLAYRYSRPQRCTGTPVTLRVAAAPELAPAVQDQAAAWLAGRGAGACLSVLVTGPEPADVAATLAARRGGTLAGVGLGAGQLQLPDVWVPDSSLWLVRLRAVNQALVPAQAPPIATSPVVVAVPEPVAAGLSWGGGQPSWSGLLGLMTTRSALHAGLVDPARDAAALSGLLAISAAAAAAGANAQEVTVGALRSLAAGESAIRADLLGRFPHSADQATVSAGLGAAAVTEQAVLGYNAATPAVPLRALFLAPAPAPMDYPYAVLAAPGSAQAAAAAQLRAALSGPAFAARLAAHGLRGADGVLAGTASPGPGGPAGPVAVPPPVPAATVDQALSTWSAITQPGRLLAVLDVSGSMLSPVPGAGGATREQVTVAAAQQGLSLFDDRWSVGLWVFSTNLNGRIPYRELLPIGPLSVQRPQALSALATVQPRPNGATGLYDTVLAAYQAVQTGWDPGRANSVAILTDGQNDNPGGLTLDALLTRLTALVDPARPVQLIAIGIGTDASQAELDKIVAVTGGGAFIAQDPTTIGTIFIKAIALRPRTR